MRRPPRGGPAWSTVSAPCDPPPPSTASPGSRSTGPPAPCSRLDAAGTPIGDALLYNDRCTDPAALAAIAAAAPGGQPCLGGTSPLVRRSNSRIGRAPCANLHHADWVASRLGDGIVASDENNALKTGYDLETESWPA